jgi:pimeloyl-ACP methyl ester carboxylesterase
MNPAFPFVSFIKPVQMIRIRSFSLLMACLMFGSISMPLNAQSDQSKRQKSLEDILKIINTNSNKKSYNSAITLKDSSWLDWQHSTGELPPDFDKMPSCPFLPEPLVLNKDGKDISIVTKEQWQEKREWIKKEFQHWVTGTIPPAPKNLKSEILSDKTEEGTHLQVIELTFGPQNKAHMTLELMIPEGTGPFPVYLTQWNHRSWAQLAVRRGYIGCVYEASDGNDDTEDYMALYPEYDFTRLMRRSWGASRVVDYLFTRKEVRKDQIALTGHSRNGKQTVWTAAFDERIAAAIPSSCGTGSITPWRYSDPQYCDETLDAICTNFPDWFHPRLRFFFGREDKLPIDNNLLISLIAPRILLVHYSVMEQEHNPWANEQCYQSVKKVYKFLGAEDNANIFPRFGEHAMSTRDLERCIDYLDIKFKRKQIPWENKSYFNYTYASWASDHNADKVESLKVKAVKLEQKYADIAAFQVDKKKVLNNLQWILGKEPSGVKAEKISPIKAGDWIDNITGRPVVKGASVIHIGPYNAMGDHLRGMLYCPVDQSGNKRLISNGKMPVIIFLHQYAYNHGFAVGYSATGWDGNARLFQTMIDKGIAVLAIDMAGFGTRLEEGTYFYDRFPQWSKMGMMVNDVKACVDAMETFDYIDSKHIFLLGNTIGGSVALMAAAQDERIAGVAVVSAVTPWRTSNSRYESLRTYSQQHLFIPRLGLYADRPQDVPVDFGEIISCIAPRPLMVIAPTLDRYADPEAVQKTMKPVENVYNLFGKKDNLVFRTPLEINRMTGAMNKEVADFYGRLLRQ